MTLAPTAALPAETDAVVTPRSWRTPGILIVLAIAAAALFLGLPRDGATTFRLAVDGDAFALPDLVVPARATLVAAALLAAGAAASVVLSSLRRRTPAWIGAAFGVVLVTGFLTWAGAGATLPLTGLLVSTLGVSVPLIFGSLSGVISERAGVVNIAIEGQFLAGAFSAAVAASLTGSVVAGLVAAVTAGTLVAVVLATFSIRYRVDQVIVGIVLNVLVTGLTTFLFTQVLSQSSAALNSPPSSG